MKKLEKDVDHAKNKVAGEIRETTGKITGNEQMELKGKMQSTKAKKIDKNKKTTKKYN